MKTIKEITSYYQRTLRSSLLKLEVQRKEAKRSVNTIFIPLAVIILFADIFFLSKANLFVHGVVLALGFAFAYIVPANYITKSYVANFKTTIITPLIHFIDSSLVYKKETFIERKSFLDAKITQERISSYTGNDFIYGNIDGVNIKLSELQVNGGDDDDLLFFGLFIVAEFPKHFKAHTVVCKKGSALLQSFAHDAKYEVVKMDSPEFNSQFSVYATDQIEARYILSHTLMQRIIEYNKEMHYTTLLSFVNGNIYIATMCGEILRPALQKSLLDNSIAQSYAFTLHFAISVVEALKLDLKLWTKQ